jgi:hypothetical protein
MVALTLTLRPYPCAQAKHACIVLVAFGQRSDAAALPALMDALTSAGALTPSNDALPAVLASLGTLARHAYQRFTQAGHEGRVAAFVRSDVLGLDLTLPEAGDVVVAGAGAGTGAGAARAAGGRGRRASPFVIDVEAMQMALKVCMLCLCLVCVFVEGCVCACVP